MNGILTRVEGLKPCHRSLEPGGTATVEYGLEPLIGHRFYFSTKAHPQPVGTSPVRDFTKVTDPRTGLTSIEFTTRNTRYRLEFVRD